MNEGHTVVVRRRWDGPESATVSAESLYDFHVRSDPGGVCRALPRGFLFARVWCDKLQPGALGHVCRDGQSPHELLVCILPTDNAAAVYETLHARSRE
jgi:hypothetical protein